MKLLIEVVIIVSGVMILLSWFSLSKSVWPEKYFTNANLIARTMNLRLKDYLIFRYLPVFIVTLIYALILQKNTNFPWYLVTFIGFFHAAYIAIPAIFNNVFKRNDKVIILDKPILLILHLLTIILSTLLAFGACYIGQSLFLQRLIPSLEGVRDNIWSAILVGFVIYSLDREIIRVERHPFSIKIENSFKMISQYHQAIIQAAINNKVDPRLLMSIAVLENINRPPWIRNIEKFLWQLKVVKSGTTGIMQVKSDRLLSDKLSIEKAAVILGEIVKEIEYKGIKIEDGMNKYLVAVGSAYQGTKEYGKVLDDVFTDIRMQQIFKEYPPLTLG